MFKTKANYIKLDTSKFNLSNIKEDIELDIYPSKLNNWREKIGFYLLFKNNSLIFRLGFILWMQASKRLENWPYVWRNLFCYIIDRNKRSPKDTLGLLNLMPAMPKDLDSFKNIKFKLSISSLLSMHANRDLLDWSKLNGVDFPPPDSLHHQSFMSKAVDFLNYEAIDWALDNNMNLSSIGRDGLPLVVSLIKKSDHNKDDLWQLIKKDPNCLKFKDLVGYSALDFLAKDEVWSAYFSKKSLLESLSDNISQAGERKKRKI